MSFITDKQTLDDLGLTGKFKANSTYNIFNKVKTRGGERLLDEMFHQPLTNAGAVNERVKTFQYFQQKGLVLPWEPALFLQCENYLGNGTAGSRLALLTRLIQWKLTSMALHDKQLELLKQSFSAAVEVLTKLRQLIDKLDTPIVAEAKQILADTRLRWLYTTSPQNLPLHKLAGYDYLLRHTLRAEMETLLHTIYQIDLYIAVSGVATKRGLNYALAMPTGHPIRAKAIWHPSLAKAVANPFRLDENSNMLFLTGANMAGKSTLMKAVGIAVYLAHIGFPVAARNMSFPICDGLYTSINLPDNLAMGLSHFYAEVLRVKKVAGEVAAGKNMVIIFDELFKGTNVKDAYDATLAVSAAFSQYRNCFFIISTHIIEVAYDLKNSHQNIAFAYMPTVMTGSVPTYPYTVEPGITTDRQGMVIIENEKILELLYA